VVLAAPYPKTPGRAHLARARLSWRGGVLQAAISARQGSGMLTSMVGIDALVEIPAEHGDVAAGTELTALLLRPV
jgi:molybdopterin biosynthesis enzyme